ncbi:MAG: hypothetical protein FVQ81_18255 [Candidatus Glassbacteria bacterium]|nr:hypothetical protein [Candidatus Glassbacteria bacterium]
MIQTLIPMLAGFGDLIAEDVDNSADARNWMRDAVAKVVEILNDPEPAAAEHRYGDYGLGR